MRTVEVRFGTPVHDRGDLDPGFVKRDRRPVGAVVVGEDHCSGAGAHAIAFDVRERGPGEHRARQVVVRVGDGPL